MHIMLDLETLSTAHNAAILSIGAVSFDPFKDGINDAFHVGVNPKTAQRHGLHIDADTVMWWMEDDKADARKALAILNRTDLASALEGFASWMDTVRSTPEEELVVWGNAPTFDCTIMRSAYAACNMEPPWRFWQERCFRTLKNIANMPAPARDNDTAHDALNDAIHQAHWVQAIYAMYPTFKA